MRIADAHCDYLYKSVLQGDSDTDITPTRLQQGEVALQCFAIFPGASPKDPYANALLQLKHFANICASWQQLIPAVPLPKKLPDQGTLGVLTVEGGECFAGQEDIAREFIDAGMRACALTWNNENESGFPAKENGAGLKPFGKQLLGLFNQNGVASDVSHLSYDGFWDVYDNCPTLIASHSCADRLCPHFRNLKDEQIRAIGLRKGFIGVNFYPVFLTRGEAALEDIVRHIDYMVQMVGPKHVGIGSDFDGIETYPKDLRHPGQFGALIDALLRLGYPNDAVDDIAAGNLLSFFNSL